MPLIRWKDENMGNSSTIKIFMNPFLNQYQNLNLMGCLPSKWQQLEWLISLTFVQLHLYSKNCWFLLSLPRTSRWSWGTRWTWRPTYWSPSRGWVNMLCCLKTWLRSAVSPRSRSWVTSARRRTWLNFSFAMATTCWRWMLFVAVMWVVMIDIDACDGNRNIQYYPTLV